MIVDLVSPWCTAIESTDTDHARCAFRDRHAALLESVRRQRTPLSDALPLATGRHLVRRLARQAADHTRQQLLRDVVARAARFGADGCSHQVLLAGDGTGDAAEPIPWPDGHAVLFLDAAEDDRTLVAALARAAAALTRWRAPDSQSPVQHRSHLEWDRWRAALDVPLREWIYTAGIGIHLASALLGDAPPHQLFGVNSATFSRLRQREKILRRLLERDLDRSEIGLLLRWLAPGAPAAARMVDGNVLPPMAGSYLAWRMVAPRIARIGLREAIRAEAL